MIPVSTSGMESVDLGLAVPLHYSAPHAPFSVEIEGEHIVRVEQHNRVVALGTVTVIAEDPATPTTCHSGA